MLWAKRQQGRAVAECDNWIAKTDILQLEAQWKELATTHKISGWQLFTHQREHLFIISNYSEISNSEGEILQWRITNV